MKKKKTKQGKKIKSKGLETLIFEDTATLAKNWQKCIESSLKNLFYAFNNKSQDDFYNQISQRVLSFSLNSEDYELDFLKGYVVNESYIAIYMGCTEIENEGIIPDEPVFKPFIQMVNPDSTNKNPYANSYPLNWDPIPPFGKNAALVDLKKISKSKIAKAKARKKSKSRAKATSGVAGGIRVTASISNHFVSNWIRAPYDDLGALFDASINDEYVARVQKYIFGTAVTNAIVAGLRRNTLISGRLNVLMGLELTSIHYPFGFRPIIQIRDVELGDNDLPIAFNEYFEFSTPCPPFCGTGGGG